MPDSRRPDIPRCLRNKKNLFKSKILERITTQLYDIEHILNDIDSKKQYSKRSLQKTDFIAPRTPIEQKLTEIWTQSLHISEIGIYDNFFDLGGHSLLGTVVMSQVQSVFHVRLPLLSIFESPTVAELTLLIEQELIKMLTPEKLPEVLNELNKLSDDEAKELLISESIQLTRNGNRILS